MVASTASGIGIGNLLGGTLLVNSVTSPAGTSTGVGINQFNFNGGLLKAGTAANATFFPAIAAGAAPGSGVFVRSGGANIDTSGQNLNIAAALLAPAGGEVTGITVTGADTAGTFITAPYVKIVGGNNDATAIAKINADGSLDSLIVTNPGSGYASAPTVTLVGGTVAGGTNITTGTATATVGTSTSGGLTKSGTGYLTVSGNNTYSGVTTISAGSITLNSPTPNPNTSYVVSSGAQMYGGWAVTGATFPNSISIAGTGFAEGIVNVGALRPSNNQTFSGTITLTAASQIGMIETTAACTFSGQITGNFALNIQGAFNGSSGTHTYTLANTGTASNYTGNTSISAVDYAVVTGAKTIVRLGASDQIPNGTGNGNLVFNGANADHQTILELNGFNETINGLSNTAATGAIIRNTTTGASILTIGDADATSSFSGVIADGGSGKTLGISKIGSGTLTLSGLNTYIGATTVNAGTLSLVGGSQASQITVAAGASLAFTLNSSVSSSSTFNLTNGTIKIIGTPTLSSYTLISSSAGITGTPTLETPIPGYALQVSGNSLNLIQAGYDSWAAAKGLTGAPGFEAGKGADPDG
ncbi:MAG: hypothetical protein CFE26_19190, partial [Verrucomicrobiales bacterium VVV1]